MSAATALSLIQEGKEALGQADWDKARRLFERAGAEGDTPEALEGLGRACWWLDDVAGVFEARERAYRIYRQRRDQRGAARVALALADDAEVFRGQAAVSNGWAERARRMLADLEPSPEHGLLGARDAFHAFAAGDMASAHARRRRRRPCPAIRLGRPRGVGPRGRRRCVR